MENKILTISAFFLIAFLNFYFLFFIVFGSKGFLSLIKLDNYIKKEQEILNKKIKIQENLENKINGLKEENELDLDLLDEEARRKLGLMNKDEKLIYLK